MGSSDPNGEKALVPKEEMLDFEFPPDTLYSRHAGDNVASSSGSNIRSFFIGMGFLPSLVDKVVEEKGTLCIFVHGCLLVYLGEDNVDLLLETLFAHSALEKPSSESSDSLDSLFDDKEASSPVIQPKEEPDVHNGVNDDKRASLLMMKFSVNEVEFAIDKLGEDAPINELVDFITAAQIAQELEKDTDDTTLDDEVRNEDTNNEALFGTMEKTLRLLEMGFSDNEVSLAIEKYGVEAPLSELANSIFGDQIGYPKKKVASSCVGREKYTSNAFGTVKVKTEDFGSDAVSHLRNINVEQTFKGKKPKQERSDDFPVGVSQSRRIDFWENCKGKRLKQEYLDDSSSFVDTTWVEEKVDPKITKCGSSNLFKANPCKSVDRMVAKPPYFFYGNTVNVSHDSWAKISQFLYALEPEFVNTQSFSALSRKEGYVHNLPTENRFHILPKSPMTIEDAIPHTKKWWPSWDTRKKMTCISSETSGTSQLCDRFGRILTDSRGLLSSEQQREILHHCRTLNLVWVGQYKLAPVEPEHIECILGYPLKYTQAAENSLIERLKLLKYSFQTDTLGYHLSALKSMYPGGLTMLSLYSGIGGAEVAFNRLGIPLKGVVSVETSETKRRILRRWWQSSEQTGELVQIEDIQRLTSNKIESLFKKFGGFDFVICQNPCFSSSKTAAEDDTPSCFDFSLFYEFVRVLQRVRSMTERRVGRH
ncbi:probable inactive DNA (cytosine-5)-methyltransferase DRM3 isoform X3 [Corylus avellana]|uniref:probable inactive DNA (cytosine-5)-methyltransferase DRM3 isoform X3 n=1 Tax=Corylus avellana TaxID=13451 RepID=UPI00286C3171|nr:probable inactive DNA (cytosine-5)-methyltransferase DRM3 isoform X3 [Corylus avellana]